MAGVPDLPLKKNVVLLLVPPDLPSLLNPLESAETLLPPLLERAFLPLGFKDFAFPTSERGRFPVWLGLGDMLDNMDNFSW